MRQGRGSHQRVVRDAYAVVNLVALLEAAQNGDRVLDRRFAHVHGLEAPLEGGVLLDVLAVLVEGGGTHHVQLAARESGLQHVGGIDRKSTRLNSSHLGISYAVFCLKKKIIKEY